jgi:hypothetical protein
MTDRSRRIFFCLIVVCFALLGRTPVFAQEEKPLFFPETGHTVAGEFLTAYQGVQDPLFIYGPPITDAFQDTSSNLTVQYFQKARLVLDPGAPEALRIHRTPLGALLFTPGTQVSYSPSLSGCRYFQETDHKVCYSFLDFFNKYGGIAQFGYPISDFELLEGHVVQFFQLARFEWHPEDSEGERVVLGDLGTEYFEANGEDPALLQPSPTSNLPQTIISLEVDAFVEKAVISAGEDQALYVIVLDQNHEPVRNAQVTFTLRQPGSEPQSYLMPATDDQGITSMEFPVRSSDLGIADVIITVEFSGLKVQTLTSFRIWW